MQEILINILAIIIYPVIAFLGKVSKYGILYNADVQHWCNWKNYNYSVFNGCKLFINDKAFRNLTYYRLRWARIVLSVFFKAYDHLQITTPRNKIGGGLIFQHGFSTIVSAESIGKNCKIYQQVTIGFNHVLLAPVIGDNVEICCGAKVIGGIRIGNNVLIGANAVVVNDIPDNSIVAGVPARVIKEIKQLRIPNK